MLVAWKDLIALMHTITHGSLSMLIGLALAVGMLTGCGGAPGYARAAKAQASELSLLAQAQDERLKIRLREAILADHAFAGFTIAPFVFMERGFVIGHVNDSEQTVLRAARRVSGLRSVDGYLPVKNTSPQDSAISSAASDVALTAEIKSALALAGVVVRRVSVETLDGQAVLLGAPLPIMNVLSPNEPRRPSRAFTGSQTGCCCRNPGTLR